MVFEDRESLEQSRGCVVGQHALCVLVREVQGDEVLQPVALCRVQGAFVGVFVCGDEGCEGGCFLAGGVDAFVGGEFCTFAAEDAGEGLEDGGAAVVGGVAVIEDGIHAVRFATAGGCDVELFAGVGFGVDEDVGAVHGHALDTVDGGGAAELHILLHVVAGEREDAVVAEALDLEGVAVDGEDGPHVAVGDEVAAAVGAQAAFVLTGDDDVADAGGVPVV